MQLFPTRPTVHMALASLCVMTAGIILRAPAITGWGGALVFGLALSRATGMIAVQRARGAGLEMVWRIDQKVRRVVRGAEIRVEVELKNRDRAAVQFASLRVIHSSELDVIIEPAEGIIEANSKTTTSVIVRAPRVGRYCLHGLAFEVRGAPGLFEAPLAFANPIGIEVVPRALFAAARSARGASSRRPADSGAPAKKPGTGMDLYELREHVSGDAFKRIAWRASARRGKLMVREHEREDRDVVWLVLDSAVELWAGPHGKAPLDVGIDEMAAVAASHLKRGDRVGLAVTGLPPQAWIEPGNGPNHARVIARALVDSASLLNDDRSDYDEFDVARRVLDHLRFLDASRVAHVRSDDLDAIKASADGELARAPYDLPPPLAKTPRDRALRRYLLCYGINSPPRLGQGRELSQKMLATALSRALETKSRPSLIYIFSTPPVSPTHLAPDGESPEGALGSVIGRLRRRGTGIRWISANEDPVSGAAGSNDRDAFAQVVTEAVGTRVRVSRERGERALRKRGVKVVASGTRRT